ncbi:MAG: L-serine ammonia-lyase [Myxococcales bacterium]|nr:L-serine ammonia-lyase [Myxococcales bacterium]
MTISAFDLYTIGIGPSSSHTVGPMRAARYVLNALPEERSIYEITAVRVALFGSLAATGRGHWTDRALLLGLAGETPETIDPGGIASKIAAIELTKRISLLGRQTIAFDPERDLVFRLGELLEHHPNGMRFELTFSDGSELRREMYSIGGGFIRNAEEFVEPQPDVAPPPMPFRTAKQLLEHCRAKGISIAELMWANELTWRPRAVIEQELLHIAQVMREAIERGCQSDGVLPGSLAVKRRAPGFYRRLIVNARLDDQDPAEVLDWISLFALAVSEENAAGGRVVTAPTNGAAGIIPAVMQYYQRFTRNPSDDGVCTYLLTAAAIGILYKEGASLSAAEVGCQGEVGVACSMASAGLAAALGGSAAQVENAAEIGMEHNLGLTCDPVDGLVQIPCIERNAMGAVKAINAARMALRGDGEHHISLDRVIRTMRQTGADMQSIYKETSEGGLAVHLTEC